MRRASGWAIVAFWFGVGCTGAGSGPAGGPGGGKADVDNGDFSNIVCQVVWAQDDNPFEEGLGSIYDYDGDGWHLTDGDSRQVDIRRSNYSKLESGLIGGIGQMSFGL